MSERNRRWARELGWWVAVLTGVALLVVTAAACGRAEPPQEQPELSNPFHSRVVLGDTGSIVEMQGFSHGHHPLYPSGFDVSFTNPTPDPWSVEYCLLLVHEEGVERTLLRGAFEIGPNDARSEGVEGTWAHDVPPGPYALVLVLPERSAQYHTIYVGEQPASPRDQGPPSPWPIATLCP